VSGLRRSLRSSVALSTAPYGYTLTIWACGAIGIERLGRPDLLDVLLFMAGAVLAFLAIELFAYGSLAWRVALGPPPDVTIWGSAHWISAGLAIVAAWGTDHLVHHAGGWALSGLLATGVYLLLNAIQTTIARAQTERGRT
jgi:hypothetical protein